MRQEAFERSRAARWSRIEAILSSPEPGAGDFPHLYRLLCQDLALARDRGFGSALVDRLNDLALRGHQVLYGSRARIPRPVAFLLERFPEAVRREGHVVLVAAALFAGSSLLLFWLDLRQPELIYHFMGGRQVAEFEAMYDPEAPHYGAPRSASDDLSAFGFYVSNNVGIAFRTFAGGVFFGIGSLFIVALNGVLLGLVAAHLTALGYAATFFPFVIGHGAFELTAIVLAGAAGLKLGLALVAPGRTPRGLAFRRAATTSVPILYGMAAMLLVAAVIEASWSASPAVPAPVKLAVGAALWVLVLAWLGFGGRRAA